MSGLAKALEHFQEWEKELPRTLTEHELVVLSEIVGHEPSKAQSAEARVLELATGEDSEVGLAERCPTVEEVSREVMENLDETIVMRTRTRWVHYPTSQMHQGNNGKRIFKV